jgi:hypothetical protein
VAKPKNLLSTTTDEAIENDRIIVNAVEGWGKTTLGCQAPKPAILMARGETGYVTLRRKRLVPEIPKVELQSWTETLDQVRAMILEDTGVQTLVLDALSGFERLCHEHVCKAKFSGDWGESGFTAFQRGYDISISEWLLLLQELDRFRKTRGAQVIFLSHSKVRPFKNPMGEDFDRYIADCHEKTWAATAKWADAVFFGTFRTITEKKKGGRTKGIGGDERVIYTTRRDAYDAKNRYGMPPELPMPEDHTQMWPTLAAAISGESAPDEVPAGDEEAPMV